MRRSSLLLSLLLVTAAACSPAEEGGAATTTTQAGATDGFPVTVVNDLGETTIDERPESIVSLSTVATEMLFAVGAGERVVAVDDQSNHPPEAPMTDLSGFTPNVEAILSYEPDLVFISYDPGELVASLGAVGVPVVSFGSAFTLDDTYRQIEAIGTITGQAEEAATLNEQIQTDLATIVGEAPELPEDTDYYHEVDNTLYTATSTTFIGQVYGLFGLENIADAADEDGSAFGFPQLSAEYIVAEDPDMIFLGNTLYGETAETVAARPGWDVLTAVKDAHIFELDSDIVSRWGPRVVDFAQSVADALDEYASAG